MEAVTYKGLKQIDLLKIALWPINLFGLGLEKYYLAFAWVPGQPSGLHTRLLNIGMLRPGREFEPW